MSLKLYCGKIPDTIEIIDEFLLKKNFGELTSTRKDFYFRKAKDKKKKEKDEKNNMKALLKTTTKKKKK